MRTALLAVHVLAGTGGLLLAPIALALPKRAGWHPRLGVAYQLMVALVAVSAVEMVRQKPSLWWLGVIAVATEAAAVGGWLARRLARPGWLALHIRLMCGSYISLVTAFVVVTVGPLLGAAAPAAWLVPTVVGSPLIGYAVKRATGAPARRIPAAEPAR